MKKNNKPEPKNESKPEEKTNISANYELHSDAVERLVNANEENSPEISNTEIKKYKKDKLAFIPIWLKALFIKFWFNGAICFFFFWGLAMFIHNSLDQIIVVALAMGIMTDLIVNNILRFFDSGDGQYTNWAFFRQKKYWTFFANILYAFVVMALVVLTYNGTNLIINQAVAAEEGTSILRVEPFLFGLLYLLIDLAFIGIKKLLTKMIKDANNKLESEKNKDVENK